MRSFSTTLLAFLALVVCIQSIDGCRPLTSEIDATRPYRRSDIINWLFTNFTSNTMPLTGACVPFIDLLEEIYNYEDYGCIHNEVTADVYLGDCVDLDSNVCYDTIPSTPTCQCIGDLDQYDCAMLAILNKHAGNQLRG